jgi:cell division transport system permease protein
MMRAARYAFDEALASLWRGRQAGLLSTATIAVALFVLGAFWLVTSNMQRLGAELSRAAEMSVYLDDDVEPQERAAIERVLDDDAIVAGFTYVSKTDALARFRETFADAAPVVDTLDGNPLPASYDVRLQGDADAQQAIERLHGQLRPMAGVADVRYDREWLDRLLTGVSVIRGVGFVLGVLLTIAAALTVANVVRLALFARRDEIEIMQLVGAPQAYIRGPFVMEGVLQGGIGATVALTGLAIVYLAVRSRYLVPLAEAVSLSSVRFLSPELCVLMLVGGMAVGCIGGLVAATVRS